MTCRWQVRAATWLARRRGIPPDSKAAWVLCFGETEAFLNFVPAERVKSHRYLIEYCQKFLYYIENYLTQRGLRMDFPRDYIVLDLETTGLSPARDSIIEVAAVKYIDGEEREAFDTLINPGYRISPMITGLTGITNADLADAPALDCVLPQLMDFLSAYTVVGHNLNCFDKQFLKAAYSTLGADFQNPTLDTLPLSRKAFPGLPSYKLTTLKEHFSINVSVSHRALPDVYVTAELFALCREQLKYIPCAPARAKYDRPLK